MGNLDRGHTEGQKPGRTRGTATAILPPVHCSEVVMLTRLLSCSLLALLLLQPAHATPQEIRPFKVCWSIYAGWMLWG